MAVYVIQSGSDGPVKIGVAADVWRRLKNLQTASSTRLRLLHVFEGGAEEEKRLHQRFASARLGGEWFKPISEITSGEFGLSIDATQNVPVDATQNVRSGRRKRPSSHPISLYMADRGILQRDFAEKIGLTAVSVSRIEAGTQLPSLEVLAAIWIATDRVVSPNDIVAWWASSREATP